MSVCKRGECNPRVQEGGKGGQSGEGREKAQPRSVQPARALGLTAPTHRSSEISHELLL